MENNRLLGIWDFHNLPWSIGDILVFVETLSVLKEKHNHSVIDLCVLYDNYDPIGRRKFGTANINSDNAQDYMLEFLPLFSTCPDIGSIYQFNVCDEFLRFLEINTKHYKGFFPPPSKLIDYNLSDVSNIATLSFMQKFYEERGYLPRLRIGERDSGWANLFCLEHLHKGVVPVSISLKMTRHRPESNADPKAWLTFIDRCRVAYPEVVFIVAGLREEVFCGLAERPNVIISKNYGTSIIEDLALIRSSAMYLGTNSGVNIIAMFSDMPYLITQFAIKTLTMHGLNADEQFNFQADNQKIITEDIKVTPDLLFLEFGKIYSTIDKEGWRKKAEEKAQKKYGHPTIKGIN